MDRIVLGDCLDVMPRLPDACVDAIVTDPPYGLAFMGRAWDHGVPGVPFWTEALRVAKPGTHLAAFGGTRTFHRLACAIEDAGWEIRDCFSWLYGCLSEDTEILVNGVWVHYRSAIEGSLALCYDAGSDTFSQQPIEQLFIYDYDDTAYRIESERTDQVVSRNHRCIVWRNGRWEFVPAEEVAREQEARVPVLEAVSDVLDSGPQAVRASRFTTSDLARITPFHLTGKVWCVKVPTGAFVARRNGKVFVTGNSGFPKSLDVSKAIDKVNGEGNRLHKFTAWMRTTGLKAKQIDDTLRSQGLISPTSNFAVHYFNDGQPAIPTAAMWAAVRPLCGEVPPWVDSLVERIEAEREVIGKRNVPIGHAFAGATYGNDSTEKVVDVTTPATEAARKWQGWGTALKPAWEPIILARKPLVGTVAANVIKHGTGAINVDGCRNPINDDDDIHAKNPHTVGTIGACGVYGLGTPVLYKVPSGRWPANVVFGCACEGDTHDDDCAAAMLDAQSGELHDHGSTIHRGSEGWFAGSGSARAVSGGERGGASRFFYTAKASRRERGEGNTHPTVKPVSLMRWLCRLVCPPGGSILDPFAGSGTTLLAAHLEGFDYLGVEREAEYVEIIRQRLANVETLRKGST
jgi:hypothetical protein